MLIVHHMIILFMFWTYLPGSFFLGLLPLGLFCSLFNLIAHIMSYNIWIIIGSFFKI